MRERIDWESVVIWSLIVLMTLVICLELAQLVREKFPEFDAICLAYAREYIKHKDD